MSDDTITRINVKREYPVVSLSDRRALLTRDLCPECGGNLDTGWECLACGYDAMEEATAEPESPDGKLAELPLEIARTAPQWSWRNCRSLGFSVRFWLWPWAFGVGALSDVYGGDWHLFVGPLDLGIHASVGNSTARHWWERFGALSADDVSTTTQQEDGDNGSA